MTTYRLLALGMIIAVLLTAVVLAVNVEPSIAQSGPLGITPTLTPTATSVPSVPSSGGPTIPEPTTIALVGLGLAGVAGYVQRKRNASD